MFLHVKANNRAARVLYASLGFVCEFREPMWYKLKNGQQKVRQNPRLFLRKVFAAAGADAAPRTGMPQPDAGDAADGGGRTYVWGNDL